MLCLQLPVLKVRQHLMKIFQVVWNYDIKHIVIREVGSEYLIQKRFPLYLQGKRCISSDLDNLWQKYKLNILMT
jgi:hypothetical protein